MGSEYSDINNIDGLIDSLYAEENNKITDSYDTTTEEPTIDIVSDADLLEADIGDIDLFSEDDLMSGDTSSPIGSSTTATPNLSIDEQIEQAMKSVDRAMFDMKDSKLFMSDRAKELDKKRKYRHDNDESNLQRNFDGTLETDADWEIRAKKAFNVLGNSPIAALDWILEATENVLDFGQGSALDGYKMASIKAVIDGKEYDLGNKDFIAARSTTLKELVDEFNNAEEDPNADKSVYVLRKFDGYNEDGSTKYLWKYGMAEVSASARYEQQYVEDGFEIVAQKRFAGAEKWENTLHSLDESLSARALDAGRVKIDGSFESRDKASGINFGAGKTELYEKDLLGLGDTVTYDSIQDATKKAEDANTAYKDSYKGENRAKYGSTSVDAFQAGGLRLATNLADFVADGIFDSKVFNKYADQEWIDTAVGYDRRESSQALTESAHEFKQGNYASSFLRTYANIDTLAESIPDMLVMAVPFGASVGVLRRVSAVSKIVKESTVAVDRAIELGADVKRADQIRRHALIKIDNAYGKGPNKEKLMQTAEWAMNSPKIAKTIDALNKSIGLQVTTAAQVNDQINERIKNKIAAGEDPTVSIKESSLMYLSTLGMMAIDKISFKEGLGLIGSARKNRYNPKTQLDEAVSTAAKKRKEGSFLKEDTLIKKTLDGYKPLGSGEESLAGRAIDAVASAFNMGDSTIKRDILKTLADKTLSIARATGAEGAQEYMQTWSEIINKNFDIGGKGIYDVFNDEDLKDEALMGFLGGIGAGAQISSISQGSGLAWGLNKMRKKKARQEEVDTMNIIRSSGLKEAGAKTIAEAAKDFTGEEDVNDLISHETIGSDNDLLEGTVVNDILAHMTESEAKIIKNYDPLDAKSINAVLDRMLENYSRDDDSETPRVMTDKERSTIKSRLAASLFRRAIVIINNTAETPEERMSMVSKLSTTMIALNAGGDFSLSSEDIIGSDIDEYKDSFVNLIEGENKTTEQILAQDRELFDAEKYTNDPEYKQEMDEKARESKKAKARDALAAIDVAIEKKILMSQGADFNNEPAIVDGEINKAYIPIEGLDPEFDDMLAIRDTVERYIDGGGINYVKNFQDVSEEVNRLGFIYIEQDRRTKKISVRTRPYIKKYRNYLMKAFSSKTGMKKQLSEVVKNGSRSSPTLENMVNWVRGRPEKLVRMHKNADGEKYSMPRTLLNLRAMDIENKELAEVIAELETMVNNNGGADKDSKGEVSEKLEKMKIDLSLAEETSRLFSDAISGFVENELGITGGFDPNNKAHALAMSGVFATMDSEGNIFVSMNKVEGETIEQSLNIKRGYLLGSGELKLVKGHKGTANIIVNNSGSRVPKKVTLNKSQKPKHYKEATLRDFDKTKRKPRSKKGNNPTTGTKPKTVSKNLKEVLDDIDVVVKSKITGKEKLTKKNIEEFFAEIRHIATTVYDLSVEDKNKVLSIVARNIGSSIRKDEESVNELYNKYRETKEETYIEKIKSKLVNVRKKLQTLYKQIRKLDRNIVLKKEVMFALQHVISENKMEPINDLLKDLKDLDQIDKVTELKTKRGRNNRSLRELKVDISKAGSKVSEGLFRLVNEAVEAVDSRIKEENEKAAKVKKVKHPAKRKKEKIVKVKPKPKPKKAKTKKEKTKETLKASAKIVKKTLKESKDDPQVKKESLETMEQILEVNDDIANSPTEEEQKVLDAKAEKIKEKLEARAEARKKKTKPDPKIKTEKKPKLEPKKKKKVTKKKDNIITVDVQELKESSIDYVEEEGTMLEREDSLEDIMASMKKQFKKIEDNGCQ